MHRESTAGWRVWHRGPPPHVGWWNASVTRRLNYWRWWSGELWSRAAVDTNSPENAMLHACRSEDSFRQSTMEWSDYWPESGRVGRIHPVTGVITGLVVTGPST